MSRPDELEPWSSDLQTLLEAERAAPGAPAEVKAQLFERLSSSLFDPSAGGGEGGGGAEPSMDGGGGFEPADPVGVMPDVVGVGTTGASAAAATATATTTTAVAVAGGSAAAVGASAVVLKVAVGVGIASFVAGGAVGAGIHAQVVASRAESDRIAHERTVTQAVPAPQLPVAPPVPQPPEMAEAPAPEPLAEVPVPAAAPRRVERVTRTEQSAPAKPKEEVRTADGALRVERSYVEQARSALARGDAQGALSAVSQHAREFPSGRLGEERDALRVQALAASGQREEAVGAAAKFRQRYPHSFLTPVVDAAVK